MGSDCTASSASDVNEMYLTHPSWKIQIGISAFSFVVYYRGCDLTLASWWYVVTLTAFCVDVYSCYCDQYSERSAGCPGYPRCFQSWAGFPGTLYCCSCCNTGCLGSSHPSCPLNCSPSCFWCDVLFFVYLPSILI